jgi:hypothetical protein
MFAHVLIQIVHKEPDPVGPGGGGAIGDAIGFLAEWIAVIILASFSSIVALNRLRWSGRGSASRTMCWLALALASAVVLTTVVLCAGESTKHRGSS